MYNQDKSESYSQVSTAPRQGRSLRQGTLLAHVKVTRVEKGDSLSKEQVQTKVKEYKIKSIKDYFPAGGNVSNPRMGHNAEKKSESGQTTPSNQGKSKLAVFFIFRRT